MTDKTPQTEQATGREASVVERIVMCGVGYEIQDNNNSLVITVDGEERLCNLEIYYNEDDGYFFDDDFTDGEKSYYGTDVLADIKALALNVLNT